MLPPAAKPEQAPRTRLEWTLLLRARAAVEGDCALPSEAYTVAIGTGARRSSRHGELSEPITLLSGLKQLRSRLIGVSTSWVQAEFAELEEIDGGEGPLAATAAAATCR